MKNSKLRRALLLVASAVLLVCVSVGATLAYLVDDDAVTNTFTVGKIYIELDETDSAPLAQNPNSGDNHKNRDKKNEYHILPAAEFVKDPIVWVQDGSEKAYLFIKVENQIAAIEANEENKDTVAEQIVANGWTQLEANGNTTVYYKIFDPTATKTDANFNVDWKFPTFEKVWITSEINSDALAAYDKTEINVTAYAIQYDGFKEENGVSAVQNAWNALQAQINP